MTGYSLRSLGMTKGPRAILLSIHDFKVFDGPAQSSLRYTE